MDPRSRLRSDGIPLGIRAVQVALGIGLLGMAVVGDEASSFYTYYALAVVLVPGFVDHVTDGRLTELHRAYLVVGLVLHPLGFALDIYYTHRWWDIVTHFVSGTMLAAGIYALLVSTRDGTEYEYTLLRGWRLHALVFGLMLSFALIWEVYEIWDAGWRVYAHVDRVTDIVMGLTGCAVVGAVHPRILGEIPSGIAPRLERLWGLFADHGSGPPGTRD